jgi:ParB/RepB/Spo0J family partition protein
MECNNETTKHIVKWKIKDLKPHPLQSRFFADLPFHLLRDLAEDMRQRGQKEPLEILPDGTIVCGHQRTRAAKILGWDEIDVWVNGELASQGNLAVEQRLIEDNLARRNLDPLDQVRCYKRLNDMCYDTPDERLRHHQRGRVRDVVGSRLGMSGRTLERYLRVLDAPREVQDAFRDGRVSLVNASKVAGLPKESQEQLAADIRAGADAKTAVAARLTVRKADPPATALGNFLRSLERHVDALEGEAERVVWLLPNDIANLGRAHALIGRLLRRVAKRPLQTRGKGSRKDAS